MESLVYQRHTFQRFEYVTIIFLHPHVWPQICDETNQARGFALITTMGGIGRLLVC